MLSTIQIKCKFVTEEINTQSVNYIRKRRTDHNSKWGSKDQTVNHMIKDFSIFI